MLKRILSSWKLMLASQLVLMLLIALCATYFPLLLPGASTPLRVVFLWILPSIAGAVSACYLTRNGLISYAAWVIPPVVHSAAPWLLIGYPPPPGSMLICAFVSLVGAATGDVLLRRDHA